MLGAVVAAAIARDAGRVSSGGFEFGDGEPSAKHGLGLLCLLEGKEGTYKVLINLCVQTMQTPI